MTPENIKISEDFEGAAIPAGWRADGGGAMQLSTRHFKDGKQSLQWTWTHGSRLIREGLAISTAQHPQAGMSGWVYCEKPVDGRLTFRLGTKAQLAAGIAAYQFRFGLNFTGWRMFQIQFEIDAKTPVINEHSTSNIQQPTSNETDESGIKALEIAPPDSVPAGCLYLDALTLLPAMAGDRSADYQIPEHAGGLGDWSQHWPLHHARQSPTLPLPETVTDSQKQDFATIKARYRKWLLGDNPDLSKPLLRKSAEQTQAYISRGWEAFHALGLKKDADGWITGPGLTNGSGPTSFQPVFANILAPLAFDYKVNGNAAAQEAALLVFDYVHDQGWAEGSANGSLWLNVLRFAYYCHAVALMKDELRATGRLENAVRTALWYQYFGKTFSRFDQGYIETNADALRSIVFTSLVMVLAMDDSPRKVQYLRGWLAWFNSALEVSPRFAGVIKPDGLGFHHRAIYASAYATCAYELCALQVWLLHGTEFAAAPQSIANLKRALQTQDIISNKYDVPYATTGRFPGQGVRVFSAYAYMALAVEPPDLEMAGIFMRLWDPESDYLESTLSVKLDRDNFTCTQTPGRLQIMQELADRKLPAAPPPQGFFSKPWGALAIHRRGNWLVSVKGWSQYVWDFEMHPKCWGMMEENVFGRFCSYGTLQPVTHGNPICPVSSGWNLAQGWDWSRWPGSTTPHLALHENYDPKSSWATRFFSSATFVGAVSCENRNGMFALKLHEHFHDPGFRAFKTYYFFDNEVICLGSNIQTREGIRQTETTLFQCWMPEQGMPIRVNGEAVTAFPYECQGAAGKPLTLMDPYGNGYFVPDSRDVRLRRGVQQSRDSWNQGETEGAYSTCWLDHGQPPRDDGYGSERYHYAMLVQTTPATLADYAKAPPYRVLLQNHQAHILEHLGQKTMAYALFETDWEIPHGIVRKTDTPVMVMVKEQGKGIVLSLVDPDLRLPKRRNMAYLDAEADATTARPSQVRVELRGEWMLPVASAGIEVASCRNGVTAIVFNCRDGATHEVALTRGCGGGECRRVLSDAILEDRHHV